jgi:hypothetical protein
MTERQIPDLKQQLGLDDRQSNVVYESFHKALQKMYNAREEGRDFDLQKELEKDLEKTITPEQMNKFREQLQSRRWMRERWF